MELAAGIAAAVYKNDFQNTLKKTLNASMTNYTENNVEMAAWDNLQKRVNNLLSLFRYINYLQIQFIKESFTKLVSILAY